MSTIIPKSWAICGNNLVTSSSGSSTLVGSVSSQDSNSTATVSGESPIPPSTYNIDSFNEQKTYIEGTIYGRVSAHANCPTSSLVIFYQARAAAIIAAFDIAFQAGER